MPADPPLWEYTTSSFVSVLLNTDLWEGWYDPYIPETLTYNHDEYYQYNVDLPEPDWFHQDVGTIYWLSITAHVDDPAIYQWGWKSSFEHFNDDAVFNIPDDPYWIEMYEPYPPLTNGFTALMGPANDLIGGSGSNYYGTGWYFYPNTGFWNIWFYDHMFSDLRWKQAYIFAYIEPTSPESFLTFVVNWSTDYWSKVMSHDPVVR